MSVIAMPEKFAWSRCVSAKIECEPKQMSCAESVRTEMTERVREIAALAPESSRKQALDFVARVLKLPHDRVRRLFYAQARRIEAHEADQIRAYYETATKLIEARRQYEIYRAGFLRDHPALARLAPGPLPAVEVAQDSPKDAVKK